MSGQIAFVEFLNSTAGVAGPSAALTLALQALWHDKRGQWEVAHTLAQEAEGKEGAWVHAYLHRKEGDETNASYWYRRAGQSLPSSSLAVEWAQIARALLDGELPE